MRQLTNSNTIKISVHKQCYLISLGELIDSLHKIVKYYYYLISIYFYQDVNTPVATELVRKGRRTRTRSNASLFLRSTTRALCAAFRSQYMPRRCTAGGTTSAMISLNESESVGTSLCL